MARKPKNKIDLKQKLARLAETVRADAETLVLGPTFGAGAGAGARAGSLAQPSRIKRLAARLNPLGPARRPRAKKPGKDLKKLAQQMAKGKSVMKIRRSRQPMVVALLAIVLGFAGYFIYRSVTLPKVRVAHVAKTWLDTTSGHHPKKHASVHRAHKHLKHALAHHKKHGKHQLAHHKHKKKARIAKAKQTDGYQTTSYKQAE